MITCAHVRQLRLDVADLGDELGSYEQHRRLAIADDEGDLGAGEPPVDRRHHHFGLHRAHQELEIEVAVLAEIGDALARLDAERDQRVRNAVGVDVELGESWSGAPRIHRPARSRASWRGRAPCRQGSSVAAKRTCLSRSVLFSLRGVWRHPAAKTIRCMVSFLRTQVMGRGRGGGGRERKEEEERERGRKKREERRRKRKRKREGGRRERKERRKRERRREKGGKREREEEEEKGERRRKGGKEKKREEEEERRKRKKREERKRRGEREEKEEEEKERRREEEEGRRERGKRERREKRGKREGRGEGGEGREKRKKVEGRKKGEREGVGKKRERWGRER